MSSFFPNVCSPCSCINHRSPENIWEQAAKKLSDEDRKFIDFDRSDKRGVLEDLVKLVNHRKQLCMEKRWKYRKGNEVVVIRDQLEKITTWIDRFKRIGDAAVQYDPVHASLPWAGVRFLLEVKLRLASCIFTRHLQPFLTLLFR